MKSLLEVLRDFPIGISLVFFVIVFTLFSFAGFFISRNLSKRFPDSVKIQKESLSFLGGAVITFLSITAGLLIVALWNNYSDAKSVIEKEGASIAILYRSAQSFPEPQAGILRKRIGEYVQSVIGEEFPAHRNGKYSDITTDILDEIQQEIIGFSTLENVDKIFLLSVSQEYNTLVEQRRLRIAAAQNSIPIILWITLLFSIALSYIALYLHLVQERAHAVLLVLFGCFIGLLIFVVFSLDNPYRGSVRVPMTVYETLLSTKR